MANDDEGGTIYPPKYSPWGQVDGHTRLCDGVYSCSTPEHGGIVVSQTVAGKLLSEPARALGDALGGFLWYEEDELWTVPMLEFPQAWPVKFGRRPADELTEAAIRAELVKTLSRAVPDYLLARGITPDPVGYARYHAEREAGRLRTAHDPDYIVCAEGAHRTGSADVVLVTTADGREHRVSAVSYHTVDLRSPLLLLSACELVTDAPAAVGSELAAAGVGG
jgi:hypothetical protein